jgi:class 3 adenylate cyclase
MPALVAGIHAETSRRAQGKEAAAVFRSCSALPAITAWMAATSAAMTREIVDANSESPRRGGQTGLVRKVEFAHSHRD